MCRGLHWASCRRSPVSTNEFSDIKGAYPKAVQGLITFRAKLLTGDSSSLPLSFVCDCPVEVSGEALIRIGPAISISALKQKRVINRLIGRRSFPWGCRNGLGKRELSGKCQPHEMKDGIELPRMTGGPSLSLFDSVRHLSRVRYKTPFLLLVSSISSLQPLITTHLRYTLPQQTQSMADTAEAFTKRVPEMDAQDPAFSPPMTPAKDTAAFGEFGWGMGRGMVADSPFFVFCLCFRRPSTRSSQLALLFSPRSARRQKSNPSHPPTSPRTLTSPTTTSPRR